MTAPHDAGPERTGDALIAPKPQRGALTLYVSGASELSARAIADATALCDVQLGGRYRLVVVDVHEDPAAVLNSQVVAAPTLIRNLPLPERRLVGDLSDTDKVLHVLDLRAAETGSGPLG
jgi:circadian clock protein KaiB